MEGCVTQMVRTALPKKIKTISFKNIENSLNLRKKAIFAIFLNSKDFNVRSHAQDGNWLQFDNRLKVHLEEKIQRGRVQQISGSLRSFPSKFQNRLLKPVKWTNLMHFQTLQSSENSKKSRLTRKSFEQSLTGSPGVLQQFISSPFTHR